MSGSSGSDMENDYSVEIENRGNRKEDIQEKANETLTGWIDLRSWEVVRNQKGCIDEKINRDCGR